MQRDNKIAIKTTRYKRNLFIWLKDPCDRPRSLNFFFSWQTLKLNKGKKKKKKKSCKENKTTTDKRKFDHGKKNIF